VAHYAKHAAIIAGPGPTCRLLLPQWKKTPASVASAQRHAETGAASAKARVTRGLALT